MRCPQRLTPAESVWRRAARWARADLEHERADDAGRRLARTYALAASRRRPAGNGWPSSPGLKSAERCEREGEGMIVRPGRRAAVSHLRRRGQYAARRR